MGDRGGRGDLIQVVRGNESPSQRWPTPTASEHTGPGHSTKGGKNLRTAVRDVEFGTPTTQDAANDGGPSQFDRNTLPLNAAVKVWATPTAWLGRRESHAKGDPERWTNPERSNELSDQVAHVERLTKDGLWTTPAADDTGHRKDRYAQGGTALSMQAGGSLNPTWVEWLMGFPLGWTVCEAWETRSSRRSRSGSGGE